MTHDSPPPRTNHESSHCDGSYDRNPEGIGLCALLGEDFRTHGSKLFDQGFWAIAVHRCGNWRMNVKPKLLRIPFSMLYKVSYKLVEWMCGISLPYTVRLGRRVRIWHHGGMILHAESIGNDVTIRQNTTMGVARTNHDFELPRIGDRADIGCHVCILGRITIGEDAVIGAGSVVLKDVPPNAVAVGVPANVVRQRSEHPKRGDRDLAAVDANQECE